MRRPRRSLNSPPNSSWIDYWIDTSQSYCGDYLGCDETCVASPAAFIGRNVTAASGLHCSFRMPPNTPPPPPPDYAKQHDAFLDSLLQEQQILAKDRLKRKSHVGEEAESACGNMSMESGSVCSSAWTLKSVGSSSSSVVTNDSSCAPRKRRRAGVRLLRKPSPPTRRAGGAANAPSSSSLHHTSMARADTVDLDDLGHTEPPVQYLHPNCRMQKDKGRGDDIGSAICAKGIDACLTKLRDKMQLLTEHCLDDERSTATMKRRHAVVWKKADGYVETRSLLTLRMGFLTMTYGVLLRWDVAGQVTFVVLRKHCHESFYKATKVASCWLNPCDGQLDAPSLSTNEVDATMLKPPFLITRPRNFPLPQVTVSVRHVIGLNEKSHWTIELNLYNKTETVPLSHDDDINVKGSEQAGDNRLVPKERGTLVCARHDLLTGTGELAVKLFEHRPRRRTRTLRCTMRVPVHSLIAKETRDDPLGEGSATSDPVDISIPCPGGSVIYVGATLRSDALVWQRRELAARRRAQRHGVPVTRSVNVVTDNSSDVDYHGSVWDYLCLVC